MLPMWLVIMLAVLGTGLGGATLLLVDRTMKGLRESYPAGTVDTVSKSIGDGIKLGMDYLRDTAPVTPTNVDDALLAAFGPLVDQIVERLRGEPMAMAELIEAQAVPLSPQETDDIAQRLLQHMKLSGMLVQPPSDLVRQGDEGSST